MTASMSGSGIGEASSRWARIMGVSLRPWSGQSPASLLLRGAIQLAVCGFFLWFALRLATDGELAQYAEEFASLRLIALLIGVAAIGVGVLALARIAVGVLDFSTATEVTGTVVSVRDRQTLDFLPHSALQALYRRNPHRIDSRKRRTELVLHTDAGTRQWTVHKSGLVRELRRGDTVRLTVTPLAGHVSRVTPVPS